MNKCFKRLAILCCATFLLAGCSLFSSEEDEIVMADLPDFEETYEPEIVWKESIGDGIDKYYSQLQPVADEQAVYAASRDGQIQALAIEDGELLWETDFSDDKSNVLNRSPRFSGGLTLADDAVIIGSENAQVIAFNKDSGELKWLVTISGEVLAQPAYAGGKVIVHTTRGDLIALDSDNGDEVWRLSSKQPNLTLRSSGAPTVAQGGVIYGRADGFLSVALLADGRLLWQLPVARPFGATELDRIVDVDMKPVINNNIIYALAYNGNLVAIDLLKGEQLWTRKFSGYSDLAFSGNTLYLSDSNGYLYAVDSDNGEQIWANKQLENRNLTGVTIANEYIVVGDGEGYLHWLDRENGQFVAQQKLDSAGLYMQPFATETHLYVQTRGGKVIAIEKPVLNVE